MPIRAGVSAIEAAQLSRTLATHLGFEHEKSQEAMGGCNFRSEPSNELLLLLLLLLWTLRVVLATCRQNTYAVP
jgi:hypothetical protein